MTEIGFWIYWVFSLFFIYSSMKLPFELGRVFEVANKTNDHNPLQFVGKLEESTGARFITADDCSTNF